MTLRTHTYTVRAWCQTRKNTHITHTLSTPVHARTRTHSHRVNTHRQPESAILTMQECVTHRGLSGLPPPPRASTQGRSEVTLSFTHRGLSLSLPRMQTQGRCECALSFTHRWLPPCPAPNLKGDVSVRVHTREVRVLSLFHAQGAHSLSPLQAHTHTQHTQTT